MPGIYHHAGCCCKGPCPCLGAEPALTVERTGTCPDEGDLGGCSFDLIDAWIVADGFGEAGTLDYPWCEIRFDGYQQYAREEPCGPPVGDPIDPALIIGYLYLAYNRTTGDWGAWLRIIGTGTAGIDANTLAEAWFAAPCRGTDVTSDVACAAEAITGTFDLVGDTSDSCPSWEGGGLEGCTFSCVIS